MITCNGFELESPNLYQICILVFSQLVLKIGVIDIDILGPLAIILTEETAFNIALVYWSRPAKGCYTSQTCSCNNTSHHIIYHDSIQWVVNTLLLHIWSSLLWCCISCHIMSYHIISYHIYQYQFHSNVIFIIYHYINIIFVIYVVSYLFNVVSIISYQIMIAFSNGYIILMGYC